MAGKITIKCETSGRFADFVKDGFVRDAAIAVTAGVAGVTAGAGTDLRKEIANVLGVRMGNAIGWEVWPKGRPSLGAAGSIYPRGSNAEAILQSFSEAVTIRTKNGATALAIPTANVPRRKGRGGGGRMTPDEVETEFNADLIARPGRKPGTVLLFMNAIRAKSGRGFRARTKRRVAQGSAGKRPNAQWVLMFVLVRSVKMPKRLDPDAIMQRWVARIPEFIDQNLPR